jgi:uncharacterized protein (TIGR03067 family)
MKARFLVMVSASLVLAADPAKEDAAKREREKLQGVWVLVAAELDGKKTFPKEGAKVSMRVEIKGERYALTAEAGKKKTSVGGAVKVNPSQKPKAVDFQYEQLGRKAPVEGIYELDGDNLKVCFQIIEGQPRPKEFSAKKGSGQALMVWKREKKGWGKP